MKSKTLHYLFILAVAGIGLAGCKSDVQLNDISVDSKVKAKVSLPIGEVSSSFGDMIGVFKSITDSTTEVRINEQGLLELTVKEHREREFHQIVLTDYIGEVENTITLQEVDPTLTVIPQNTEITVPFTLTVTFNGVNDDTSDERLDSMVIDQARFTTKISSSNLTVTDNDIQKVTMVLGDQFRRAKGKSIELPNFHLDQDVPIEIDEFTLVMMKDESAEPAKTNVVNTADIRFDVLLKTGENVMVAANSGFKFQFQVEMLDYKALYGYFKPGKETSDDSSVDVPLKIPGDEPFCLPAKDPQIDLTFTYGMSMPLQVYFRSLKAIHPNGEETPAVWDGNTSTTKVLRNIVPMDAPYDASVQSTVRLDKDPIDGGSIDKFFEKEVQALAYDYELLINEADVYAKNIKQFRLTKDTKFELDFAFKMPFEFKKGLNATYADTIKDINLERAQLDSLAAMTNGIVTKIDSAELTLYLSIYNEIPVNLVMDAEFLDGEKNKLDFDVLKDIKIVSADMKSLTEIEPVTNVVTVPIHTEDFEEIAKTKAIRFKLHLGDDQKESAFPAKNRLKIKAGVTGNIEAVLNLELGNKDKK